MLPKESLREIIIHTGKIFSVKAAASVLRVSAADAAKTLARWAKQGWLIRIKRGLYVVVPLEAESGAAAIEDSWVLLSHLFPSGYLAGWSAAEYWDLTEQVFHGICVATPHRQRQKLSQYIGIRFVTTKISKEMLFGLTSVWRDETKINISDLHKTIIDMLFDPKIGGGMQHCWDCVKEYFKHDDCDFDTLCHYALQANSGVVFKRLGYICEVCLGREHPVTLLCYDNITQGYIYLDPTQKTGTLLTRWNLFVPQAFKE